MDESVKDPHPGCPNETANSPVISTGCCLMRVWIRRISQRS